jgi:hypothetical protein
MRLFITLAVIGAAFLLPSAQAKAAITVGSLVPNQQNELEDDDFDQLVNAGGTVAAPGADTIFNPGDFIAGIIRIGQIRVPAGGAVVATAVQPEPTFTALVLQKIATVTPLAGGVADGINDVTVTFTPPTLAEWASVFAPVAGAPIATSAGSFAVVFEDPNDIDQTLGLPSYATPGGTELWELGFNGTAGELFSGSIDTADSATAFATVTGSYTFNMNVTEQGAGPVLAPQLAGPGPVFAQMLGRNGSIGNAAPGANPPFPISTDVDLLITPLQREVPEPVSVLTWLGLLGICGLFKLGHRLSFVG